MPVLTIECTDCGHRFVSLVLDGTQKPKSWHCSKCGNDRAQPDPDAATKPHPWESESPHGSGCPCCG